MEKIYKNFVYCLCVVLALCFSSGCSAGESGAGNNGNPKKQVKIGDCIKFGKYEQDNDTSNGKEDIEWIVLDIQENKALLISICRLDSQPFEKTDAFSTGIMPTWENCSLRKWLNNSFINVAFSLSEQEKIVTTKVTADENPNLPSSNQGKDTYDKIFVFSLAESNKYLVSNDNYRYAPATKYASAQSGTSSSKWYWLRTTYGWGVICTDSYDDHGGDSFNENVYVRPAMWIALDS